jgi:hypothetical protein
LENACHEVGSNLDGRTSLATHTLKGLAHKCNLFIPESAKAYLAKDEFSINRKEKICEDLDRFYKYKNR